MDLDTAKENIQPLKGGRNMERLGIAISALEQKELQENLECEKLLVSFVLLFKF